MFKWLGQGQVVFEKQSNWLVKVANAFVVAFGGIMVLIGGILGSFCGYTVLRTHRLKYVYRYLITP